MLLKRFHRNIEYVLPQMVITKLNKNFTWLQLSINIISTQKRYKIEEHYNRRTIMDLESFIISLSMPSNPLISWLWSPLFSNQFIGSVFLSCSWLVSWLKSKLFFVWLPYVGWLMYFGMVYLYFYFPFLSICLSIKLSSISLSVSIYLSIYASIHLSIFVYHLSMSTFCLYLYLYTFLSSILISPDTSSPSISIYLSISK